MDPAPTNEIMIPEPAAEVTVVVPEKPVAEGVAEAEDTTTEASTHASVEDIEKDTTTSTDKEEDNDNDKEETEDAKEEEPKENAAGEEEEQTTEEAANVEQAVDELAQLLAGAVVRAAAGEEGGAGTDVDAGSSLGGLVQQLAAAAAAHSNGEGPMLKTTREGLDELGLKYEVQEASENSRSRTIVFGMNCKVGLSRVVIATEEADKKFHFYIKAPASVPEPKRTDAAVFLTWVNYGLSIGNFELDMSDGEVRFKSSNHLVGSELSTEMVGHTVALCVKMIDQFFPGLMAVVYGGKDPKEAHDDCMSPAGRVAHAQ